jgi:hypothetical protein
MKTSLFGALAAGLCCGWASAASYDAASGMLTLDRVQVGPTSYLARLRDLGNLRFHLQEAIESAGAGGEVDARYDPASLLVDIPLVEAFGGLYHFRLQNQGDWQFQLISSSFVSSDTAGPFEPDDRLQQARDILVADSTDQVRALESASDQDWISFYADADTIYTLRIADSSVGRGIDPVLAVFDAQGIQLATTDLGFEGEGESLDWTAPVTGIYYLRVSHNSQVAWGADNGYGLRVFESTAPQVGMLRGSVRDACTWLPVAGASIVTEPYDETRSHDSGSYGLPLNPGEYRLTVSASGFPVQTASASIQENGLSCVNFDLGDAGACADSGALDQVSAMFLAYTGRPASASEAGYWSSYYRKTGNLAPLQTLLGSASEYLGRYAAGSAEDAINRYHRLSFGRDAGAAEIGNWVQRLGDGRSSLVSIGYDIWQSVGGSDRQVANNRISAAKRFSSRLAENYRQFDSSQGNAASAICDTIGASATSLDAANQKLDALLAGLPTQANSCQ